MVNCNDTQFCVNTVGSFQCVCRPGYGGEICTQKGTDIGRPSAVQYRRVYIYIYIQHDAVQMSAISELPLVSRVN